MPSKCFKANPNEQDAPVMMPVATVNTKEKNTPYSSPSKTPWAMLAHQTSSTPVQPQNGHEVGRADGAIHGVGRATEAAAGENATDSDPGPCQRSPSTSASYQGAERAELSGSADCGFRIVVRDATAVPDPRPSAESAVATGSATVPAPQHRHPGGGPARRRPGRGRTKPPRTREPRRRPADSRGGGSWQR